MDLQTANKLDFTFCPFSESESESELLLVTRSNGNHSPGAVMREVSP